MTEAWKQYEQGIQYKNSIKLFSTVRENLNFYHDRQWEDCKAPGMPMPVMNIIKPSIVLKVAHILDPTITMKYNTEGEAPEVAAFLSMLTLYGKHTWKRLRMDKKNLLGLTQAANTGDYVLYHWWNSDIETGQPFKGDMDNQLIDNVNYFPGNPNDAGVQSQPYIILAMRKTIAQWQSIAKANGVKDIDQIKPDEETDYTAGDYGKIELDEHKKATGLLKMWKQPNEDGKNEVWFSMELRNVTVQPEKKANLKLYPISKMCWEEVTNCAFGKAQTTGMKANQVFLNKQMGFIQAYLMQTAFPPVIYSKSMIREGWSNKVVKAIGVEGVDVSNVARYMQPPQLPADVWVAIEKVKSMTMELMGANDIVTGNVNNPENRSAYIAARDSALFPLQAHQMMFYDMIQDMGLVWLDMFLSHYEEDRMIAIEEDGMVFNVPFDKKSYEDLVYDCEVEVGASKRWSELAEVTTLENLLQSEKITFSQFLEQVPPGYIPNKDKLLPQAKMLEQQQQQLMMAEQAAQMQGI